MRAHTNKRGNRYRKGSPSFPIKEDEKSVKSEVTSERWVHHRSKSVEPVRLKSFKTVKEKNVTPPVYDENSINSAANIFVGIATTIGIAAGAFIFLPTLISKFQSWSVIALPEKSFDFVSIFFSLTTFFLIFYRLKTKLFHKQ